MSKSLSHSFSTPNNPQLQNEDFTSSKTPLPRACKFNFCSRALLLIFLCILPIGISQYLQIASQRELTSKNTLLSDSTPSEPIPTYPEHHFHIRKSISDPNEYRYTTLSNGLKVLMISDPTAQKSSAALILNAGSFRDPPEIPGLVHLLEHILTIGSKKYSKETYTNQVNGGAWIALTETMFYYNAEPSNFERTLDIFADPFIDPRFDFEWYETEIHRIDQEQLGNAGQRLLMLLRYLVNPDSLLARDIIGNLESFYHNPIKQGINVSQALYDLFEKHYSANLMSLVVMHDKPLDEIQRIITASQFSQIPNKNLTKPNYDEFPLPLSDRNRHKILTYSSHSNETQGGSIAFQICGVKSKPETVNFIMHLMKRNYTDSLITELLMRHFFNAIHTDFIAINSDCGIYYIDFNINPRYPSSFEEIVQTVFGFLHKLIYEGLNESLYNEYLHMQKYFFQYSFKDFKQLSSFAGILFKYSREDIFSRYDEQSHDVSQILAQARSILLQMNTDNLILIRSNYINKEKTDDSVTKIGFRVENLPENLIEKWNKTTGRQCPTLNFSQENPFIPKNFHLINEGSTQSQVKKITENIWYGSASHLKTPQIALYVKFPGFKSSNDLLFLKLLTNFFFLTYQNIDYLTHNQLQYAGNSVSLSLREIKIKAFSESLPQIIDLIPPVNTSLRTSKVFERNFPLAWKKMVHEVFSSDYPREPEAEARNLLFEILANRRCTSGPEIKKNVSDSIVELSRNLTQYQSVIDNFFANPEFFIYGNISPEEAVRVADKLASKVSKTAAQPASSSAREILDIGRHKLIYRAHFLSLQKEEFFVLDYYQGGAVNAKNLAYLEIFIFLIDEWIQISARASPFGAEVHVREFIRGNTLGFVICGKSLQDPKFPFNHFSMSGLLQEILELFMKGRFVKSQEELEKIIQRASPKLIKSMQARSNSFYGKSDEIFGWIDAQTLNYAHPEDVLECLKRAKAEEFMNFLEYLQGNYGKISIQGFSQNQNFSSYPVIQERNQTIIINSTDDLQALFSSHKRQEKSFEFFDIVKFLLSWFI